VHLSIVVPALDEEQALPRLLGELLPLLRPDEELLVVDGGSRDRTVAAARAAGLPAEALLVARAGRAAQQNHGAAAARGEWLWFLHADAGVDPAALEALRAETRAPTRSWGRFRVRLDAAGARYRAVERGIELRSTAFGTPSGDQGLFVRRALFLDLGGFPDLPLCEDLALADLLRARERPRVLGPALRTSARRWEQGGVLRTVARMWAIRAAYRLGVAPARLARWYAPVR
jgi:rSAM/selenodomain-associated transferase 2